MKTRGKALAEKYGNVWIFDGTGVWWCNDGIRYVMRENDGYWLYGYGQGEPRRIWFNEKGDVEDVT